MSWTIEDNEKITFGDNEERNSSLNSLNKLMVVNKKMMSLNKKTKNFSDDKKNRNYDEFSSTESFFHKTDSSPSMEIIKKKIDYYKNQGIEEELEENQFMSIMKKVCFEESHTSSLKQSKCYSENYNPSHSLSVIETFKTLEPLARIGHAKKLFLFSNKKANINKNSRKGKRGNLMKKQEENKKDKNEYFDRISYKDKMRNKITKKINLSLPSQKKNKRDKNLNFYGISNLTTIFKSYSKQKPDNPTRNHCLKIEEISLPITDQSAFYNESISSIRNSPNFLEPEISKMPTKVNKFKFTIEKLRNRKIAASENDFNKTLGLSGLFKSIENKKSAEKLKKSFKTFEKKLKPDKCDSLAMKIKSKLNKEISLKRNRGLSRSNSITSTSFLKKGKENIAFNANKGMSSRSRSPYSFGRFRKLDIFREKGSTDFGLLRSKLDFKRKDSLKERLDKLKGFFNY